MRKYILILMILCLHIAARGQTGYQYDYWFDNDRSTLKSGSSESGAWQMQADVSGLDESIHAIHLQVRDQAGNLSSPITRFFVKSANVEAASGRYWFDDNIGEMQHSPQVEGVFDIDVSHLTEGFHSLHYQMVESNGTPSSMASRYFYKANMPAKNSWRCWFDNEQSTQMTGTDMGSTILLDVSELVDGYHLLHILADGGAGSVSVPTTIPFIKIPQVIGVDHLTCLCMVDDHLHKQEQVSTQGGVIAWKLDVSSLPQGFHRMFVQVITPSGAATSAYQAFFLRTTSRDEFAQMKCVYAIDGNEFNTEAGVLSDGTFYFDLNVADLEDGLHTISYMLSNGLGVSTKTQTQFFTKIPLGGYGIAQYEYWVNKNYETRSIEKVAPRQDPFNLISLLPVESQPLRSSNFLFAIKNNAPVIYAKNEFHIRFYDASGRFTETVKEYVDEKVKQQVEPVGDLEATQTFDRVEENGIRWYTLDLEEGDSVAFKSSQACSMQLFTPSGQEVYNASGASSVQFDGCHSWEEGTYYLAVHDVTGSQSRMTLEYEHIDKYVVLSHSPKEVGVMEGNFYVQLFGNGYDKLTKAQLVDNNNVLIAEIIKALDASNAILQFSFANSDYPHGDFDLVLEFTDGNETESVIIEDAVTITDPIFGDIAVEVTSRPAVAQPYPVTITIKNTGNVTYQFIPLFFANSINRLESVHLLNFGIQSSRKAVAEGVKTFYKVDNLFGEDSCIVIPTIIPALNPYQSLEYQIGFVTGPHARFNMYAWTETPWSMREVDIPVSARKGPRRESTTNITCEMNPCDLVAHIPNSGCVCNVLWGGVSAIANAEAAMNQWRNNQLRNDFGQWYQDNNMEWTYREIPVKNPADIIDEVIRECLGELAPDEIAQLQDALESALDQMRQRDPQRCPPPPPHPINPYMPGDPNEITGYLAESGSHCMTDKIKTVGYDIEFENDPELANSSAHSIVIEDQLDPAVFDLGSFTPKDITIGNKKVELNGEQSFVTTLDLRTEIDAIAELRCDYNSKTGKIKWTMTSLAPMSMEPTDDIMQGILPINTSNGNGIGHVTYTVDLLDGLAHGKQIVNKASIVFDKNDAIETPTWTNIVDAIAPTSQVSACEIKNDTTATLHFESEDELSGVWKYDVYVQYEENASWTKAAEGVTEPTCDVRIYEGVNHGFYVVATDSAGNVEIKEPAREYTLDLFESTEDSNLELDLAQGWNWISHNLNSSVDVAQVQSKALRILGQEEEISKDATFGFVGDLSELKPTLGYKVQMADAEEIPLNGKLFNASYKSISLATGWNWIGYPLPHAMEMTQALENFTPAEGDFIVSQEDFSQFMEGEWIGTLTTLEPGKAYLYKSGSNQQMFFNSTAELSSRVVKRVRRSTNTNPWTCDMHKYPNAMAVTAQLYNGDLQEDVEDYYVAAFCGNECRGVGKTLNGLVMMNIYGQGGEPITFKVIEKNSEQLMDVVEGINFTADVLGSAKAPYRLSIGEAPTDIANLSDQQMKITPAVIKNSMTVKIDAGRIDRLTVTDLSGKVVATWKKLENGCTVDVSNLPTGVHLVTVKAGKKVFTKKVMKVAE